MKVAFILILIIIFPLNIFSQTQQQKNLQAKKETILTQIEEMKRIRQKTARKEKSMQGQMNDIEQNIRVHSQLIEVTRKQMNLLEEQIKDNTTSIQKLTNELSALKKEYAHIIQKSYKSRSKYSQLLYILTSDYFFQGYKRLKYIKQYADYRHKQGIRIKEKNLLLKQKNDTLITQRKDKALTIRQNTEAQNQLSKEKEKQEKLIKDIRKKDKEYQKNIALKQRELNRIDKEIDRLVQLSIREANAKKNTKNQTNTTTKKSTPQIHLNTKETELARKFEANRGYINWPIERGYKSRGFGSYADPVYPDLVHYNNGVTLASQRGAKALSVFEGEVSAIISIPNGNKAVQIRHGHFITTYYNLSDVFVKKGQKVVAKTELGSIFTDSDGNTELKFFLYKNSQRLNPERWLKNM